MERAIKELPKCRSIMEQEPRHQLLKSSMQQEESSFLCTPLRGNAVHVLYTLAP